MTTDQSSPTRTLTPLTAAQREIWLADRVADDATAYSTALVAHTAGPVDFPAMTAAIDATLARSEAARVRFVTTGGEVWQEITDRDPRCEVIDFRGKTDPSSAARAWIDDALARPYDTAAGPLLRACLLRVTDDRTLAFLAAHHLVLDGTAVGMLLSAALTRYARSREAGTRARADRESDETAWSLDTLVAADETYRTSPRFAADRDFWLGQVADAPVPPRLLENVEPGARRAEIVAVPLTSDESTALYGRARELRVRTAGLLLATLAGFLYRRTGQPDLLLATPMSGRSEPDLRAHLGTLATVLPLRVRLRAGTTWRQLAGDIDTLLSDVHPHSRFRGEDLRRALRDVAPPRPLFGVGANILPITTRAFTAAGLDARLEILSSGPTGDVDVFFEVDAAARSVAIFFHGPGAQRPEMTRLAAEYADYLRELLTGTDAPIGPPLRPASVLPAGHPHDVPVGTLPGTEEWVIAHDDLDEDAPAVTPAVFTVPTPPRALPAQVRAVCAAVSAAHPELALRPERPIPGLWEYVPGPDGAAFGWIPGTGAVPGTLVISAHPLLVDGPGRALLRDEVAEAFAAIGRGEPPAPPAADEPAALFDRCAQRAGAPEVLARLDRWRDLTVRALPAAPLDAPRTAVVDGLDTAVFAAAGLTPTGAALAALGLALGLLGESAHSVVAAADDRRDGVRTTLPLGVATPAVVRIGTDPAAALRDARSAALEDGASTTADFGLLRHLHPQAGPALTPPGPLFTVGADDDRGLTVVDHGTAAHPDLHLSLGDAGTTITLRARPPGAAAPETFLEALRRALELLAAAAADPANRPIAAVWGLSPLQEGLYFQSAVSGEHDVYNAQFVLTFDRALEPGRLRRALAALMADHPVLRAGFTHDGRPAPVQFLVDPLKPPLETVDLRGLTGDALAAATDQVIAADRIRRFDLDTPPLWRVTLVRRTGGDALVVSRRFLLWDGWSNGLVIGGLLAHYAGTAPARRDTGEPVFARYLRWIDERDRDAATAAWAGYLDGYDEPSLLRPGADPVVRGGTRVVRRTLDAAASAGLTATAQRAGVTLNTVLATALALVTGRWSGRGDVVIGQTVAGRPSEVDGADTAVGMFLNTVPVRARLRPAPGVAEFLREQQAGRLDVLGHDWLSLGEIAAAAGTPALFDVLLVLQNFIDDGRLGAEHGVTDHDSEDHTHFALTVVATRGPQLAVAVETRDDLIDDATAAGLADDLFALLTALSRPDVDDVPLARLPVTAAEPPDRGRTLDVPGLSVSELLAATAAREPAAPALVFADATLTFGELDAEINRLARLLLAEGARCETVVALAIERSIEMVVALFAVLRTGAAYLPLELVHPASRLRGLVDDARPVLALTAGADPGDLDVIFDGRRPPLDLRAPDVRARLDELSGDPLDDTELGAFAHDRPRRLDHPAYLIYTSGSTGKPKGVVTGYRGLTTMYLNHEDEIFRPSVALASREGRRRLAVAHTVSFAFDMSWEELLWLTYGHTVHICDEDLRRDPQALVTYCDAHRVDVVNVTPTYAEYLIGAGLLDNHRPALVLLGGEAVGTGVWDRLRDEPGTLGYNLYGPTEYTINTLGGGTTDSASPTVGRPIGNTVVHLLDPWLRPVPPGVAGELYVEGDGLARGYHDRPGLTALSFVAHPDDPGRRLYRTGDLMRRRAGAGSAASGPNVTDGLLDYLGRTDFQLKIRGFRVEPTEIEAALVAIDGIGRAVVTARGTGAQATLAAYLVPDGTPPDFREVRRTLAITLPPYMIPSSYTLIDEIPVTVNGKRDLAALPAPAAELANGSRTGSLLERVLAEIAAQTFGLPEVDVDANLFDLGAHSLQLMTFADAVRARLGVELAVSQVFADPSIAAIAAMLDGDTAAADRLRAPVIGFRTGRPGTAPVVVLPPGTGLGWRFGQLLPHLPEERGVYAVQSPQISGDDAPERPADVVAAFADRIDAAVPAGPVVLLGWSFGGSLTPAVADELIRRGRSIDALVLLDAWAQSPDEYFAYLDTLSPDASALGALGVPVPGGRGTDLSREEAIDLVRGGASVFAGLDAELVAAVLDSSAWSLRVMRELPARQTPVDADVLYVEAEPAGSLATWGGTLAPRRHLPVPWAHGDLLGPDAVAAWGPALTDFLAGDPTA
ncbi:condensation domain-containing protein [Gordonia sp. FQ]|uniref:condensation domain-containing protein n=1 Tax=Gordonia sp. FQ TaxID=3446634 RepID=UPI003F8372A6